MNKKTILGLLLGIVVIIILGFAYVLRPTAEVSQPIEALPLEESQVNNSTPEVSTTDVPQSVDATESVDETNPSQLLIFIIDQARSEARFSLDEILRGNPFTAIGKTNQVAGEIGIDFSNPAASQLGTILINARDFKTDSNNRDRAIKNQILDTNDFEYILFEPREITGFPEVVVFGEVVELKVIGNLTIRDITKTISFDVSISFISDSELQGYGSTIVLRSDFDLKIPSVSSVAEVTDEVLIELDFFASGQ